MNELKRELSKLSGVDFFNPKYRDVFKKYFTEKEDAKDEVKDEDVPVMDTEEVKKEAEPVKEDAVEKEPVEEKVEDVDKAEDEREIDKIEEEKAESPEKADEKAEEVDEESKEIGEDVDELETEKSKDEELLDAKIELELMKSGVKPEKLEVAKKYTKHEVLDLGEIGKIKGIIAEFPDWVRAYKAEDIGMPVDEDRDALTEEEKRLKEMGIDPR
jgi:hypothetical protein